MESSPELEDLTRRIAAAVGEGDVAFLEQHTARQSPLICLGTAPGDWWTDVESLTQVVRAQQEAGVGVSAGEPIAYQEGEVGWAVDRGLRFRVGDEEIPFRVSAVYHREDGEWRMVHFHCSVGVPDEDQMGTELPT